MREMLIMLCLAICLPLYGCEEDTPVRVVKSRGTKTSKTSKSAKKKRPNCRKMPANLVAASWVEREGLVEQAKANTLRDPFEVSAENLAEDEQETEKVGDPRLDSVVAGYEVAELKFTMSVTGQPPAFALLKDPSGFGHDVYVGDIVGSKPRMRVEAITNNEIIFRAVERVKGSDAPLELKKSLLTPEELQELQP